MDISVHIQLLFFLFQAAGQQVGQIFPQTGGFYMPPMQQVLLFFQKHVKLKYFNDLNMFITNSLAYF